jgi:hypothetical protein
MVAIPNTTTRSIIEASLLLVCGQQLLGNYSARGLAALQAYNVEKAIVSGRSIEAIKRWREAAIHLGEAGLHRGVPNTIYAEVETNPFKMSKVVY